MNVDAPEKDFASQAAKLAQFVYSGEADPSAWSFMRGFPDPAYFPRQEFLDTLTKALQTDQALLQYGWEADESLRYGEPQLRAVLTETVPGAPKTWTLANVMLTQGGVAAIELAFKAFLDPGDVLLVESPTWGVALTIAHQLRAHIEPITIEADGLDPEAVLASVRRLKAAGARVKMLYTIPTFQTPTGAELDPARRSRLAAIAESEGFLILEDSTYVEMRYDGVPLAPVQAYDSGGLVLQLGSFSKTLAPALRLGWVAGPAELLAVLAAARTDLGVNHWLARGVADFIRTGQYQAHLATLIDAYRRKRDRVHAALTAECGDLCAWIPPGGGYFFWLQLTRAVDGASAKALAKERGVLCRPGEQFFGRAEEGRQFVRLAFSQVDDDAIADGISAFGGALRASLER